MTLASVKVLPEPVTHISVLYFSNIDHHNFNDKDIPHIKLNSKKNIKELVEIYANSGFNGRRLGEAAKLYSKMIHENATICLTVAGALTPVGFGGIIKTLLEKGFVDWIVTTGANVYHEDHFAWGFPVKQGHSNVDDNILYDKEICLLYTSDAADE